MIAPKFKAAWWMKNPHLQTIAPSRLRKQAKLDLQRHRLQLQDGDFLDLDIVNGNKTEQAPILLLFHGLEGSVESQYMQAMLHQAKQAKWTAIGMHFRGCSEESNLLLRSYHSGETADLEQVIQYALDHHPGRPILAAGFSLGGSALLNLLAHSPYADKLVAACTVSVPFDLAECATRMNHGFSRVYRNHFLTTLRQKIRRKQHLLNGQVIDFERVEKNDDFWAFDHLVTAPLHGFLSATDYYQRCSSRPKLKAISRPTLIVHSLDDPFMHSGCVPKPSEVSASIELEITQHGGHLGFVSGNTPFRPNYSWLEKRIMHFFEQQLAQ